MNSFFKMPHKCKEARAKYQKKWREENKEKIAIQKKEYHLENQEKISLDGKQYYLKNKEMINLKNKEYKLKNRERLAIKNKEYALKNKEKISIRRKEHYLKNKEKIQKYKKEYNQSPEGIKNHKISGWRLAGIIDEDFSSLYDYLIKETNCMICLKPYTSSRDRCLDHDHSITDEPNVRYICCNRCNVSVVR